MLTHDPGENPPGGTELPPANTAPGARLRTSATVGFGAMTICAAFSWRVILATKSAALAWHSALGQVTLGTMKSAAAPSLMSGPPASVGFPAAPPSPPISPPDDPPVPAGPLLVGAPPVPVDELPIVELVVDAPPAETTPFPSSTASRQLTLQATRRAQVASFRVPPVVMWSGQFGG